MSALRPMVREDALAVFELSVRTFAELAERFHEPPPPAPQPARALVRLHHVLERDPGGAWVAEHDGEVVGAALAIDRDGLWGLSLLVVDPAHQSRGLGRALLGRALAYADGGRRGGVILASSDSRALRTYARAGFAAHPCLFARGHPVAVERPPGVREGGPADRVLADRVDRAVRGTAHGDDIDAMLRAGSQLLVAPERGYAVIDHGRVRLLAALDEETAADLLRAAMAAVPPGEEAVIEWVSALQRWAVAPVVDAGLTLRVEGAVFLRGDVGPFRPYLPSGAYL
jgi:GNAT superfamily N-acetyltransferase